MIAQHIIRIEAPWLRIPMLCVAFPFSLLHYILCALRPTRWGGHPNKWRLLHSAFYAPLIYIFWAAWDGNFVPTDRQK